MSAIDRERIERVARIYSNNTDAGRALASRGGALPGCVVGTASRRRICVVSDVDR